MKSFLLAASGTLSILLIAAVVIPVYSDYTDRAQTSEMLMSIKNLQKEIEKQIITGGEIVFTKNPSSYSRYIENMMVLRDGTIIAKGGKSGQVFILVPSISNASIIWKCIGGNNHAMPPECRSFT